MENGKKRGRVRLIAPFVIGVLAVVSGLALGSGEASAHSPVLSGRVTCDGMVHFTATSWTVGESGTNPDVEIFYLKENTGPKVSVMHGSFSEANGYSFSGTFPWPDGAELIVVYAEAQGLWADGVSTIGNWWTEWLRFGGCQETTTTIGETTTTMAPTTTIEPTTTTIEPTTTTIEPTTTIAATTTTTIARTTTTIAGTTTTTVPALTTTTQLGSGGPTTTTTQVGSQAPTTTVSPVLPRTGSNSGPIALVALGLGLIGFSLVLTARRIQA